MLAWWSAISRLQPRDATASIGPGTAKTSRPYSIAAATVSSAPERSGASTTTTARARPGDDPVAPREVRLAVRLSRRQLGDEGSSGGDEASGQVPVTWRVDPVERRRQHRHAAAPGRDRRQVRLSVDPDRQAAHHRDAGTRQLVGDLRRACPTVAGRSPGADDRHARRRHRCRISGQVQQRWPRVGRGEGGRVAIVERGHDAASGHARRLAHACGNGSDALTLQARQRWRRVVRYARQLLEQGDPRGPGRSAAAEPLEEAREPDRPDAGDEREGNPVGLLLRRIEDGEVECRTTRRGQRGPTRAHPASRWGERARAPPPRSVRALPRRSWRDRSAIGHRLVDVLAGDLIGAGQVRHRPRHARRPMEPTRREPEAPAALRQRRPAHRRQSRDRGRGHRPGGRRSPFPAVGADAAMPGRRRAATAALGSLPSCRSPADGSGWAIVTHRSIRSRSGPDRRAR